MRLRTTRFAFAAVPQIKFQGDGEGWPIRAPTQSLRLAIEKLCDWQSIWKMTLANSTNPVRLELLYELEILA